jgi:glycosyltransferase involved in cell wall biosynthesis
MNEQPLVSVVIPTRARPELVIRAVQSALSHTYQNVQVIVVIDGSDTRAVDLSLDKKQSAKIPSPLPQKSVVWIQDEGAQGRRL